jgi:hypothetical protein
MDRPPPDPAKLLAEWMEWERGDATPGRVMATLKTSGLRQLLEALAAQEPEPDKVAEDTDPASWTPTV